MFIKNEHEKKFNFQIENIFKGIWKCMKVQRFD